jgi:ribosomal protein L31
MEMAYLKESTAVRSSGVIIPKGTKLYVDIDIDPDGDMAQVKFPKSHPKYSGLHTVVPKEKLLLDMKSRFQAIQQMSDVLSASLRGNDLSEYEIEVLGRVFPEGLKIGSLPDNKVEVISGLTE